MATVNPKPMAERTHEGAVAARITPLQQLLRSVNSCLLWEREFYEDGETISTRIVNLVHKVDAAIVADIARHARSKMKLRHVPLLLVRELARHKRRDTVCVADVLNNVIQRPDELTEFLAIYWKGKRQPLSAQVKKGLAKAFTKFDGYQLAKYNRATTIKLRDVLFLCHAKPENEEQAVWWKNLVEGTLEAPDTWEVSLSAGKNKRETFERLLKENKLGAMALLRNLRNMEQALVDHHLIVDLLRTANMSRVLPFRFISAAKAAPSFEPELEAALFRCTNDKPRFDGRTVVVVDCSGSMDSNLSERSIVTRFDAAAGLAMICREICHECRVFAYGSRTKEVGARRGFALRDVLEDANVGSWTKLGDCINVVRRTVRNYDRIFVFTDEQTADTVPSPMEGSTGYVVNVASAKHGVGYGKWNHIDGFSEAFLDYVKTNEDS